MIDSHAHVADEQFNVDRDDVFTRAQAAGVTGWVEIGTSLPHSQAAVAVADQYQTVWASVGMHPSDIATLTEATWQELEKMLELPKVVAVGEVGFDFYRGGLVAEQQPVLERFMDMAVQHEVPVIFHMRSGEVDAHEVVLNLLHTLPAKKRPRGVLHTFSGNAEQAAAYLELGLYLSFSGVVTFKNAGKTAEIARTIPLERILIETDCPYLSPEPHRGERNEPAYVVLVAQKIAELRRIPVSAVDEATHANTTHLFALAK